MNKKLTVILGAGASNSINSKTPRPPRDNQNYRPPLAKDLFNETVTFGNILHEYRKAEMLASYISKELSLNIEGHGIEQILSDIQKRSETNIRIRREFLQVPLYLNSLFGNISSNFTTKPDEYNLLIDACLDNVDEVLFLTLNYDCLLEIPLSVHFNLNFSNEDDYIKDKSWKLIKLHGSINWYRQIVGVPHAFPDANEYYKYLDGSEFPLNLSNNFILVDMKSFNDKNIGDTPVYPALTVPVDGKDYNCPSAHYETVKSFLKTCKNYLAIGTSGNDQDLMNLLKSNSPEADSFLVVGNTPKGATSTHTRFLSSVPQLSKNSQIFEFGFTTFAHNGKMYEYLKSLK